MSKQGDQEAERLVVAHYLVHRRRDIRDSTVRSDHFTHGKFAGWWAAAEVVSGASTIGGTGRVAPGQDWRPADLGIDADSFALLSGVRPSDEQVQKAEKRIVRRWQVRYLAKGCQDLVQQIGQGEIESPEDALNQIRVVLGETEAGGVVEATTHRDVGIELFREWAQAFKTDEQRLLPIPLHGLSYRVTGWQPGKLYLVGAVTSGHKTTFGRMAAWHCAAAGYRSLLWTMEDTAQEMASRTFASQIKQIDTRTFTTFRRPEGITEGDFQHMLHALSLHLDSKGSKQLRYLEETLPRLSRVMGLVSAECAKGLDFVCLDFMQLIQPDDPRTNETQHWFLVSNALAGMAKRLNVPVVCTVQPTQAATRDQARLKRPLTLGDLRGGSAIAQSAYGVLLFNRVYQEDGEIDRRYLDIEVAKWKNADTGGIRFKVERSNDLILD